MLQPSDELPATLPSGSTHERTLTASAHRRVSYVVLPEIAANVREEDEAVAATITTAQVMVQSAVASANTLIAAAKARRNAALRPILRQLGIDDATPIVATERDGERTLIVVEVDGEQNEAANG
jgi:hypothetical protein